MINFLRTLFIVLFIYMVYTVVHTSLQSNLFDEWSNLAQIPWLTATLKDFYVNTIVISVWVIYKENNPGKSFGWIIAFVLLGSIATTLYLIIKLFRMDPNDSLDKLFRREEMNAENI